MDPLGGRISYDRGALTPADLDPDPIVMLQKWLDEAVDQPEPSAMCLGTVDENGRPRGRVVLLRGFDHRGLAFYTNYQSQKGRDLDAHPLACATFWWPGLERQVRVEGAVSRVSPEESDAYFAGRPRESRLAALISPQSREIASRDELEAAVARAAAEFPDEVPRPPTWGGYRLEPDRFEFWQGRPARLHDRYLYERDGGSWRIARLAP